jgi:uncharacterized Tic20 family protein
LKPEANFHRDSNRNNFYTPTLLYFYTFLSAFLLENPSAPRYSVLVEMAVADARMLTREGEEMSQEGQEQEHPREEEGGSPPPPPPFGAAGGYGAPPPGQPPPPPGGQGYQQPPPPGGPQQYYYPPPGWYWYNGKWYNTPMAEDGTWLVREDRTMAMLAHLLAIFTWFIGPLVIYLTKKDESRFVAFHALQALYFEIIVSVALLISALLVIVLIGFCFMGVVGIGALIYQIILAVRANEGRWDKYWLAGDWAANSIQRQYHGRQY